MTETQGSDEFGASAGDEYAVAPEPEGSQGESSADPTDPGRPAPAGHGAPEATLWVPDAGVTPLDVADELPEVEAAPTAWSRPEDTPDDLLRGSDAGLGASGDVLRASDGFDGPDPGVTPPDAADDLPDVEAGPTAWSQPEDLTQGPDVDLDALDDVAQAPDADLGASGDVLAPEAGVAVSGSGVVPSEAADDLPEAEPAAWVQAEDTRGDGLLDPDAESTRDSSDAELDSAPAGVVPDSAADELEPEATEDSGVADEDEPGEGIAGAAESLVVADEAGSIDDYPDPRDDVADEAPEPDGGFEGSADVGVGIAMPLPPETGERRVDEAVAALRHLGDRPTEEHVSAYDATHNGLQDVLADLDRDPDGS